MIGIGQTYLANLVGLRVMQDLRDSLYPHLQNMPLRFFTSTRTGEIQSRLANDVGGVQTVVTDTASSHPVERRHHHQHARRDADPVVQLTVLSLCLTPVFLWLTVRWAGRAARSRRTRRRRWPT